MTKRPRRELGTRGDFGAIPRTCLYCRKDARPRWAYCSDECSQKSRDSIRSRLVKR